MKTILAVSAITISDDRILLVRRSPRAPELWAPPGGKVEDRESLRQALQRETKEEIGVELHPLRLITETEIHGHTVAYVIFCFLCDVIAPDYHVQTHSDALDYRWCTRTQSAQLPLAPGVRDVLSKLMLVPMAKSQ